MSAGLRRLGSMSLNLIVSMLLIFTTGCTTIILNNDAVMKPPVPDDLPLSSPVCVKLNYETDNLDFFNDPEGVKKMHRTTELKYSTGLFYYNIVTKCDSPIAEHTVRLSMTTRNWWARMIWATSSYLTLGVIPFYVKETGKISVLQNGKVIAESEFEEQRLTSILAFPKWVMDTNRSIDIYSVDAQSATVVRKEAVVLIKAIEAQSLVQPKVRP